MPNHALGGTRPSIASGREEGVSPLLLTVQPHLQYLLGAGLGTTIQKGHKTIRHFPKEGYRGGEGSAGQDT